MTSQSIEKKIESRERYWAKMTMHRRNARRDATVIGKVTKEVKRVVLIVVERASDVLIDSEDPWESSGWMDI